MILVDKDIKNLIQSNKLIISGYNPDNINCSSYDLTIGSIIKPNENDDPPTEINSYTLEPNEYIYIKTNELLSIPHNLLGIIAEKNSIMRTGLVISGPHFQPGSTTYAFLRVYNMSYSKITINKNTKIAQIFFEKLNDSPDIPYDQNPASSFTNEITYRGFGNYKNQYIKNIEHIHKIKSDIDNKESTIYSNILTFMGIFVSIFSLITINFEGFLKVNRPVTDILLIDLSLTLVITIFMGLILIFVNRMNNKKFSISFIVILLLLIFLNVAAVLKYATPITSSDTSNTNLSNQE